MFFSEGNSYYEKFPDGRVVCIDDEIPFEVPQSWEWIRLGSIVDFSKSGSVKSSVIGDDAWILDLEDIEKDTGKLLQKKRMRDLKSKSDKHPFSKGDVLYSKLRPYLNKVIIADEAGYCTTEILSFDFGYIFNRYAQLYLMSPFFVDYAMSDAYGVKMPRLGSKQGNAALMPIPPKSEQIRIVKEVDAIMPLVARYGKSQKQLDDINSEMKDRLRKSVLQEAIQGKLVSQVPSDEPANSLLERIRVEKQKLLKADKLKKKDIVDSLIFKGEDNKYYENVGGRATDISEEIPFDIPKSWAWCRLGSVIMLQSGQDLVPERYFTIPNGIPYITGASNLANGAVLVNRWTNTPTSISHKGDLLITCKGTVGTMAYNTIGDIHIARQIMSIHSEWILIEYIEKYLEYSIPKLEKAAHSIIPGISRETILTMLIPIPPLEEQGRILGRLRDIHKN